MIERVEPARYLHAGRGFAHFAREDANARRFEQGFLARDVEAIVVVIAEHSVGSPRRLHASKRLQAFFA